MLKSKLFWLSAAVTVVLAVALMPYQMFSDIYIPDLFASLCVLLTLVSAPLLGIVFYQWRAGVLFGEFCSGMIMLLILSAVFHGIFAMMNWCSAVFCALCALCALGLAFGKIIRKK